MNAVEANALHFRTGQYSDACDFVEKHHYSHRTPANIQLIATLHKSGGLFGDAGEIVAAVFFSIPPTRWAEDVIELSRLVRASEKVFLSSLISKSCSVLARNGHNLVVSFADRTHGHFGGVYQSSSWIYAGSREKRMDGVLVNGAFIPGRSANSRWGTRSPTRLSELGVVALPHYDDGKHLYYKPLNVAEKGKAKRLGLTSKPYPVAVRPQDNLQTMQDKEGATPSDRSNLLKEHAHGRD